MISLSKRALATPKSVTMKLNEVVQDMQAQGDFVFNLTSGQLLSKPPQVFIDKIQHQLNFTKSFQYAPVKGYEELLIKFKNWMELRRGMDFSQLDALVGHGSKQCLFNLLGQLINPLDEVLLLAPYWVSYRPMVEFWGGRPVVYQSRRIDSFVPNLDELFSLVTQQTKVLILNSPNNPTGIHYDESWMRKLGKKLLEFPHLFVISDEIYSELSYFDPKPTYFYQYEKDLLPRTAIVSGMSKTLAATGLRIGFTLAQPDVIESMAKHQSQTTSGANSLIQRSLIDLDFQEMTTFLKGVNDHHRSLAFALRKHFSEVGWESLWYQSNSAFYFLLDFSAIPQLQEKLDFSQDHSEFLCREILQECKVALVPGQDFSAPNMARLSLVLPENPFLEALDRLTKFLTSDANFAVSPR